MWYDERPELPAEPVLRNHCRDSPDHHTVLDENHDGAQSQQDTSGEGQKRNLDVVEHDKVRRHRVVGGVLPHPKVMETHDLPQALRLRMSQEQVGIGGMVDNGSGGDECRSCAQPKRGGGVLPELPVAAWETETNGVQNAGSGRWWRLIHERMCPPNQTIQIDSGAVLRKVLEGDRQI